MDKIMTEQPQTFYYTYPSTVAVVAVRAPGSDNVLAAAWHTPISFDPPIVGVSIAPKRYSHDLIIAAGDFTVNFLPWEEVKKIAGIGGTSGRNLDKFVQFGIGREAAMKVKSPILSEAYASLECRLIDHKTYGDHTLFVGQVLAVHYSRGAFDDEGKPRIDLVRPVLYLGADWYVTTDAASIRHVPRGS